MRSDGTLAPICRNATKTKIIFHICKKRFSAIGILEDGRFVGDSPYLSLISVLVFRRNPRTYRNRLSYPCELSVESRGDFGRGVLSIGKESPKPRDFAQRSREREKERERILASVKREVAVRSDVFLFLYVYFVLTRVRAKKKRRETDVFRS